MKTFFLANILIMGYKPDKYKYQLIKSDYNPGQISVTSSVSSDKLSMQSKIILRDIVISVRESVSINLYLKNLNEILLPRKNTQFRIRTQKQLNLISIIIHILQSNIIDELTISTYTLNKDSVEVLKTAIHEGLIKKLNLIIASSYKFRDRKHYEYLIDTFKDISNIAFVWIHAKITLIECNSNFYIIEGSMNYSTNNMIEQILFEENEIQYKSDYTFLTDTLITNRLKNNEIISWDEKTTK